VNKYKVDHPKHVLLLKEADSEHYIVCDEYYPTDSGRVHIRAISRYATYLRGDSIIEIQKVVVPIIEIFMGRSWPAELAANPSDEQIVAYFVQA